MLLWLYYLLTKSTWHSNDYINTIKLVNMVVFFFYKVDKWADYIYIE